MDQLQLEHVSNNVFTCLLNKWMLLPLIYIPWSWGQTWSSCVWWEPPVWVEDCKWLPESVSLSQSAPCPCSSQWNIPGPRQHAASMDLQGSEAGSPFLANWKPPQLWRTNMKHVTSSSDFYFIATINLLNRVTYYVLQWRILYLVWNVVNR